MKTWIGVLLLSYLFTTLSAGGRKEQAEPLRFVAIPTENNLSAVERYSATQRYLSSELDRPVKVIEAIDYTAVIEALRKKRADVDFLGLPADTLALLKQQVPQLAVLDSTLPPGQYGNHHNLEQAIAQGDDIAARRILLTHIGHQLDSWLLQHPLSRTNTEVAYDGLQLTLPAHVDGSDLSFVKGTAPSARTRQICRPHAGDDAGQ